LGYHEQAMNDFKVSARLGNAGAQKFLRSMGIVWQ
jgi:hypothetical protein